MLRFSAMSTILLQLVGCTGVPEGVRPVEGFELERYLGTWYEIARLDHFYERGLSKVTAEYSLRDDGLVKVVNRGYSAEKGEWQEITGRAKLVDDERRGHLKVSFFGPFYASYVIFELDDEYRHALVTSRTKGSLWLLSRSKEIDEETLSRLIERARSLGFETEGLIMVDH
jgi:apolipoprotein D and lipocalin family protein